MRKYILLSLCLLAGSCVAFIKTRAAASLAITAATPSTRIVVHAADRGRPYINFEDGLELPASYSGATELQNLLKQNAAEPRALASADFDEDGVPDLVCGYARPGGGIITLHRGNVDSIFPNSPEAQRRRAEGTFTDSAFLSQTRAFEAPVAADFVGAGDFDADSHWDVVIAARGKKELWLLSGDGKGSLLAARQIALPGAVTSMVTGEINRADGLTDIVVGVVADDGPKALVFEGPEGALKGKPEIFSLPAEPMALALGQFDNDYPMDLAVGAGSELVIVHGRDRKLSLDEIRQAEVRPARLERRSFGLEISSIAAGDFTGSNQTSLALLAQDGTAYLVSPKPETTQRVTKKKEVKAETTEVIGEWPGATQLVCARVSNGPADDLLLLNEEARTLQILKTGLSSHVASSLSSTVRVSASLDVDGEPLAVLPMRLNADALSDLVVLNRGVGAPIAALMTHPVATYSVDNTNDSGAGSLRQAILDANAHAGTDAISFNIPGSGVHTITPTSPLATIVDSVMIDGTTEPGFVGSPLIELSGQNAGVSGDGLTILAGSSHVKGLVINRFGGDGISIQINGQNTIQANYIGTDASGAFDLGNSRHGVSINDAPNNTIGGTISAERNLVSGNDASGIAIAGSFAMSNSVLGNLIGPDISGTASVGNGQGVYVGASANTIGASIAGSRNVISANGTDVVVSGVGNFVKGNFIGPNISGTAGLSLSSFGVSLFEGESSNIGGTTAGDRNIISGHQQGEIQIVVGSGNLVQGNYVGTDVTGTIGLGSGGIGIDIQISNNNAIGGVTPGARNIISGKASGIFVCDCNGVGAIGNSIQGNYIGTDSSGMTALSNGTGISVARASNTLVGGASLGARNIISANGSGIFIQGNQPSGTQIQGNYIGVDVTGSASLGNSFNGIECSSPDVLIGGTSAEARNIISANGNNGIAISFGSGVEIAGNYIGTDLTGTVALSNGGQGIEVGGGSNITIGGSGIGAKNVISGNSGHGIHLNGTSVSGVIIKGNHLGTTANGSAALSNGGDGVRIEFASNNTIGGIAPAERNVISGNTGKGLYLISAGLAGNTIQGNYIGTDATGTIDLGNLDDGIFISGRNNTVGGTTVGAGNIISGNNGSGIFITGSSISGNVLQGNHIGTDVNGSADLGNSGSGLRIANSPNNAIGGSVTGAGNVIAFNGASGVLIYGASAIGNAILHNAIFSNTDLGIDLEADGVTANDAGDGDTGANRLQNFPVLSSATLTGTNTIILGTLNSAPNSMFTLEFFSNSICDASGHGEGATFLGSTSITTDGGGNGSFNAMLPPLAPGQQVTATTTDATGNTSEFSQCIAVTSSGGTDTVGLYDPSASTFFLRNSNSSAPADLVFGYGPAGAGWLPIVGDWNGDGVDTIGLYDPSASFFFLRNSNSSAPADLVFSYGPAGAGWIPIAGDWNGDGTDTIGLYDPATSAFFLRNSNTSGPADLVFGYGPAGAGWLPIAGDWNADGADTIGLYNPATSTFFLSNSNSSAPAALVFTYGPAGAGWKPLARDWNGDGVDTIGLYNPTSSTFFLRNSNSSAPADLVFAYGPAGAGWIPIAGDWDGL